MSGLDIFLDDLKKSVEEISSKENLKTEDTDFENTIFINENFEMVPIGLHERIKIETTPAMLLDILNSPEKINWAIDTINTLLGVEESN